MRILLVDDHPIVREGYRRLLERQPGYHVVAEAKDAKAAFEAFCECSPDVVLLDVSLSGSSGIDVLRRIRQRDPLACVVMFTMHESASVAKAALAAGAKGYVTKNATPSELLDAILKAFKGQTALSADVAHAVAIDRLARGASPLQALTPREVDIFRELAQGRSVDEIAEALRLSTKTVHNYRTMIKAKLDITSDAQLVLVALEHGYIGSGRVP